MRRLIVLAMVCLAVLCSGTRGDDKAEAKAAKPKKGILLLGSLEEWKYPGSKMPGGATMTGNGPDPPMQFVLGRTVLTTPDSFEKVVEFYTKKFGISDKTDKTEKSETRGPEGEAQASSAQDDSKGRPVGVRVFLVNREKSATTLVVSRAEGEKETHIAWTHFVRIGDEK